MTGFESFAARLQQDHRLQNRVGRLDGCTRDEVVRGITRVANDAGFELSVDELDRAIGGSARGGRELDADELSKVSGGAPFGTDQILAAAVMGKLGKRARAPFGER